MHLSERTIRLRHNAGSFTLSIIVWFLSVCSPANGQITVTGLVTSPINRIPVAVPFLTLAPDAVSSSMGDAGVASLPDVHSQHRNGSIYSFMEQRAGAATTLTSWQTDFYAHCFMFYTSGYYLIDEKKGISGSFRYFSLGTINFPGIPVPHSYVPREWAIDAGYNRKLTGKLAIGILLRYIHSDLTDNQRSASGDQTYPGRSLAMDLGLYFQDDFLIHERNAQWAWGLNLSNLGSSISYTKESAGVPIPSNLRIGERFSLELNKSNTLSLMADLNKLLVPTPPLFLFDTVSGDLSESQLL